MTETLPDITDAFVEQVFALVWAKQRQAEINPLAIPNPPGHVVVAPGQTIGSDWGNVAWNQSIQRFASAADRDNQWPAPTPGAVCFTEDVKRYWEYTSGAWRAPAATIIDTSSAGPIVGARDANKPLRHIAGRAAATSDPNGILVSPLPAGVTAVVTSGASPELAASDGFYMGGLLVANVSLTQLVWQLYNKGGAVLPNRFVSWGYWAYVQL